MPHFLTPIKTMQDLMNNPYFLFTLISTKQVFLTPASPTPYLVKLQRPATNCCHDLYTFVTFDTVYLVCLGQLHRQWHWRAISQHFPAEFKHPTTMADWSAYTSFTTRKHKHDLISSTLNPISHFQNLFRISHNTMMD